MAGPTTLTATAAGNPADISLNGTSNNFVGTVNITNAQNATVVDSVGGLTLGSVTTAGNVTATSTGGALTLGTTSANTLTAFASGDLNLGTATVDTLSATSSTGDIRQSGALVVAGTATLSAADDIILSNASNNFAGIVNAAANDITIQDGVGGLTFGTVTTTNGGDLVATTTNGALNLGQAIVSGDLSATASTGVNLGSLRVTGDATTVAQNGNISQSAAVVIGGTTSLTAPLGEIALSSPSNNFVGSVGLTAKSADIVDGVGGLTTSGVTTSVGGLSLTSSGGPLSIGTTSVAGDLLAVSTAGAITQSGALTVSGAASFDASTVGQSSVVPAAVTLSNASNNFAGPVTIEQASAVTLVDAVGGIQLANVNDTGTLTVTSTGGAITQTADSAINAGGVTTLSATSAPNVPANISLNGSANNFTAPVNIVAANNVTLVDGTDGLELGTVVTSGGLTALAQGGDLEIGTATVGGSLTTTSAGATDLGRVTITGDVSATAGSLLDLGTLTLTNSASDLTAVSTGRINPLTNLPDAGGVVQTGPLLLGGNANISSPEGAVSLTN